MKAKKSGSRFVVRLEKGEEIVECLKSFCEKQKIFCGSVSGIGAVNKVVLKFFDPETKEYFSKEFSGKFEVAPLLGNVSTMNKQPYLHLHISLSDSSFASFGGHLEKAIVSATFECIIEKFPGKIERKFDEKTGLNLLSF